MRSQKRTIMHVTSVILVFAEILYFSKRGYFARFVLSLSEPDLLVRFLGIIIIGAALVVLNMLIVYCIFFKNVYFHEQFDSDEDERKEAERVCNPSIFITAGVYILLTVWELLR